MTSGTSKTLDNGIWVLRAITQHPTGITVTELAAKLALHRTVVHRLVKTLESHGLIRRDTKSKQILPGLGLLSLAESVQGELQNIAKAYLEELSSATGATSYLVSKASEDEVVALLVVEPRNASAHVAFRAGHRHSADRGSAGIALQTLVPPQPSEREAVTRARQRGYAVSHSEVIASTVGVASPIRAKKLNPPACIGISVFEGSLADELGTHVLDTSVRLGRAIDFEIS